MTGILKIESVERLLAIWPSIVKEHQDPDAFLTLVLAAIGKGVVFVALMDSLPKGVCCVTVEKAVAIVHCLPADQGKGLGKEVLKTVRMWAQSCHLHHIEISTDRLNGSSFRYFEKTLGFRRSKMTFEMKV